MPKPADASEEGAAHRIKFGTHVSGFEEDLYGPSDPLNRRTAYLTSIDPTTLTDDDPPDPPTPSYNPSNPPLDSIAALSRPRPAAPSISAPRHLLEEADAAAQVLAPADPFAAHARPTVADSATEYLARARASGLLDPRRLDPPVDALPVPDDPPPSAPHPASSSSALPPKPSAARPPLPNALSSSCGVTAPTRKRKRRWDVGAEASASLEIPPAIVSSTKPSPMSHGNANMTELLVANPIPVDPVPKTTTSVSAARWDVPSSVNAPSTSRSRWDAPPAVATKASRWDATPMVHSAQPMTPHAGSETPRPQDTPLQTGSIAQTMWASDIEQRNRPWTDDELDQLLPTDGYMILEPPSGYVPNRNLAHRLLQTPAVPQTPVYSMPAEGGMSREALGIPVEMPESLKGISLKPEDYKNFAKVLDKNSKDEDATEQEQIERRIMRLLLKIKNGAPSVRKVAMRQISERAREFGAGPLLNQLLPLLMSPTLEHQERHLYVKVIDRILYKLDDLVRPHVHKILVVIEPMLIDDDFYARVEGREIISNLSKVAGLATMISAMRPDIDHQDEFVRNTTARAFAVVTSALGIPSMLMFLRAVCGSKKSWEARHTGTKIIQQVAILMGVAVLPHLNELVEIIQPGLMDDQAKVRLITAFALANLAEASAPYGIESFDSVLKPLWEGIRLHRGKTLAAFLKAIGFIIPLMDAEYANYYAREVNRILIREFKSPDEDMKSVVLKVVVQCVSCSGVEAPYVREDVAPEFFRCFWIRRMALDRRNFKAVVDATLQIAVKIGGADVIGRLADDLKDESDPYRRMVVETVEKVTEKLGLSDIDGNLEGRLVDGLLFAFREQNAVNDTGGALRALSIVIEKLHLRAKPYMEQIVGLVKWRLNNRSAKVREQAADLISKIAAVMMACKEDALMAHMGTVLFEYLGEEFPDVLGSILRALKSIVEVIGIDDMKPPVNELLPRLTPILKNRHEKVQENCIILVGKIANKGARFVSSKEWMRICFELLELLKAPRKAIRKSAVATFGYIAKAIGPSNVLTTLLNNLKVQERTQRVCTTVAIAIVAETCQPYTVLPSLMNEYRIPELHVQNGILKSLSFLFEYIGPMAGDYIYAVLPILEDALIDRDLVHRQTACSAVGHLALGVRGLGVEDALIHLLNHVWPNIFETSPHVINAVMSAIQGCTVALGPGPILLYILQGLFHPAKKVREVYWRIYNSVYVYAQEGLVPFYPSMTTPDINPEVEDKFGKDRYERHELFLLV